MPALVSDLPDLLQRVFGHRTFRAHQRPVCEAAAAGRDVLLVMPTGAGKSLCYQLPALARGGTGLVISPLIALMDDQAGKLAKLGLRVARIHSGLSRDTARQACRDYLDRKLDFLFIAPERLRVPGFPEMLARQKPALIAIDEAHCISQWGHDFRPDYRTLAQHLALLRPTPVIALTATATPAVQQDVLRALNLQDPAVFITGFRRDNLHIEVTELSKPQRTGFIAKLLSETAARPAIVYASSRKSAEELATELGRRFPTAVYHAGLDAGTRDRVQTAFLSGKSEVIVATVAFGMGIDKADVRTVVHAALPGSVEAYYQEIGRAGRDGQPSRTVLLHNFADRRTLEFLMERNYPAVNDIQIVADALHEEFCALDDLQRHLRMDRETLERCIDKLLAQGAAVANIEGALRSNGQVAWERDYDLQVRHRRAQIDRMVAFAEGTSCRMTALVRHFGDTGDRGAPCGQCDVCRPEGVSGSAAHPPTSSERDDLRAILSALHTTGRSAGKLFAELRWPDRRRFDTFVDALARAGLLSILTDTFRGEDGRDIRYRKLSLTSEGRSPDDAAMATVWLRSEPDSEGSTAKTKPGKAGTSNPRTRQAESRAPLSAEAATLEASLKAWRLEKARAAGVPAFTIFHDSVLHALASVRPSNLAALGEIRGLSQEKLNRFGAEILSLCHDGAPRTISSSPGSSTVVPPIRIPSATASAAIEGKAPRPAIGRSAPLFESAAPTPKSVLQQSAALDDAQQQLDTKLRHWRREQAAAAGLPSFFVLSDTALRKLVTARPQTLADLRSLSELGRDKLDQYGEAVVNLCRS